MRLRAARGAATSIALPWFRRTKGAGIMNAVITTSPSFEETRCFATSGIRIAKLEPPPRKSSTLWSPKFFWAWCILSTASQILTTLYLLIFYWLTCSELERAIVEQKFPQLGAALNRVCSRRHPRQLVLKIATALDNAAARAGLPVRVSFFIFPVMNVITGQRTNGISAGQNFGSATPASTGGSLLMSFEGRAPSDTVRSQTWGAVEAEGAREVAPYRPLVASSLGSPTSAALTPHESTLIQHDGADKVRSLPATHSCADETAPVRMSGSGAKVLGGAPADGHYNSNADTLRVNIDEPTAEEAQVDIVPSTTPRVPAKTTDIDSKADTVLPLTSAYVPSNAPEVPLSDTRDDSIALALAMLNQRLRENERLRDELREAEGRILLEARQRSAEFEKQLVKEMALQAENERVTKLIHRQRDLTTREVEELETSNLRVREELNYEIARFAAKYHSISSVLERWVPNVARAVAVASVTARINELYDRLRAKAPVNLRVYEALRSVASEPYSGQLAAAIIDIGLPDMDGVASRSISSTDVEVLAEIFFQRLHDIERACFLEAMLPRNKLSLSHHVRAAIAHCFYRYRLLNQYVCAERYFVDLPVVCVSALNIVRLARNNLAAGKFGGAFDVLQMLPKLPRAVLEPVRRQPFHRADFTRFFPSSGLVPTLRTHVDCAGFMQRTRCRGQVCLLTDRKSD